MRAKAITAVGLLLAVALVCPSCKGPSGAKARQGEEATRPPPEAPAPENVVGEAAPPGQAGEAARFAFTLNDQEGRPVSLSDFAGKVVVLEWVNPDCPYVQRHYNAGTMKRLAEKYAGQGVVWLAVNSTHYMTASDNRKWIERYGLPYRILDDHDGKVGRLFGAATTPHMFVFDKGHTLAYQGAIDDDVGGAKDQPLNYVEAAVDELLAGKSVSRAKTKPYGCTVKYAR